MKGTVTPAQGKLPTPKASLKTTLANRLAQPGQKKPSLSGREQSSGACFDLTVDSQVGGGPVPHTEILKLQANRPDERNQRIRSKPAILKVSNPPTILPNKIASKKISFQQQSPQGMMNKKEVTPQREDLRPAKDVKEDSSNPSTCGGIMDLQFVKNAEDGG